MVSLPLRVKFISISALPMSLLVLLICLQVESALHKDHVVGQWQEQISDKTRVRHSSFKCFNNLQMRSVFDLHFSHYTTLNFYLNHIVEKLPHNLKYHLCQACDDTAPTLSLSFSVPNYLCNKSIFN